ncbi:MAG: cytochrome c oxidase subunit 3 [Flavobacteriaceae bacterium]|nr:cytochrome c oxidase subunit 3 [Flavobacteriaceae bacterium]
MDLTQGTERERIERSKKMMLWFAMISFSMAFLALISSYVISAKRPDWLQDFELPQAFLLSTIAILISSVTFYLATKAIRAEQRSMGMIWLLITLVLGLVFCYLQFEGFEQLRDSTGYYPAGDGSNVTTSMIYAIVFLHIAHLAAAIICLLVVIYNHYKQRYNAAQTLGIELAETFWHFLDFLWIALFLFFYFYRP